MSFVVSAIILFFVTFIYIYLASTGVLAHAGLAKLLMGLALAFEQSSYAFWGLWEYLYSHSFCPWLMIVRRRATADILLDYNTQINNIKLTNSISENINFIFEAISLLCETFFGPTIGLCLALFQIIYFYKFTVAIIRKIFNKIKN